MADFKGGENICNGRNIFLTKVVFFVNLKIIARFFLLHFSM